MTERSERSPLSRDVIRHLKDVPRIVAMGDSRHGAIHGTSLEVVQHLILNGNIPGSQRTEFHYQPGDLSVFPTSLI